MEKRRQTLLSSQTTSNRLSSQTTSNRLSSQTTSNRLSSQTPSIRASVRRSRRSSHKRKSHTRSSFKEIPGLFHVKISPSLQSLLSCRIGINITNDKRWVYVDKRKLLSELKVRRPTVNKNSGFTRIKSEIKAFPENYILVGSYGGNDFLVCLSEYAKNVCENWMEEEKKMLREGLLRLLSRDTFQWRSLGSDEEIDQTITIRSPFYVQLELQIGANIKFDSRLPNDCKDGYVEFVETRVNYNILLRKRVDKACQILKLQLDKFCQTAAPASYNRCVQYKYTYPQIKESKEFNLRIYEWLQKHYNKVSSILSWNTILNIYIDDIFNLPNQKTRYSIENPNLIVAFYDCIVCQGKVVNCIAWNANFSGIIAAAYAKFCPKIIVTEQPKHTASYRKVMDDNLVLLWDVTQPIKPLLYLHANREITALNFCPYNPNILVGGSLDGQIIVWDLCGRLDYQKSENEIQKTEVFMLIKDHMSWMKYPQDDYHLYPCVISKLDFCHKSHITVIKWLPPEYQINKLGEFVKCRKKDKHMQFLTTALDDSTMLVWDLSLKNRPSEQQPKKGRNRLACKRPKILDVKKSSFAILNSNFKPVFRLNFFDSVTKKNIHVNDFSFRMGTFCYKSVTNESIGNILKKTRYVRDTTREHFSLEKNFLAATGFGQIYNCSWVSHEYDQGLETNFQNIKSVLFSSYHDGPVYHMQRNVYQDDIVLTTGGRVFAIWDNSTNNTKPLIWRKGSIRYVMAVWALENPLAVIAAREDAKIELWDFAEDTKLPLRMTKLKGDQLLSVFLNNSINHVMKNTCLTTDFGGTLSIYSTPSKLFAPETKASKKRANIKNIHYRREVLGYWNEFAKRRRVLVEDQEEEEEEEEIIKDENREKRRKSSQLRRFSIRKNLQNEWQTKEYARMYNVLIEKHKINLHNMEMNKGPLKELFDSQVARQIQIDKYIANREKDFQKKKLKLFREFNQERHITVHFPKEIMTEIKSQYYENYRNIEKDIKKYIKNNKYRYFFDFRMMLFHARKAKTKYWSTHHAARDTQDYSKNIPQVGRKSTNLIITELALLAGK